MQYWGITLKTRTSPIAVNKTRSCDCKFKYWLLWLVNLESFLFYFSKKMGRSGDGKRNTDLLGMILSKKKLFSWEVTTENLQQITTYNVTFSALVRNGIYSPLPPAPLLGPPLLLLEMTKSMSSSKGTLCQSHVSWSNVQLFTLLLAPLTADKNHRNKSSFDSAFTRQFKAVNWEWYILKTHVSSLKF